MVLVIISVLEQNCLFGDCLLFPLQFSTALISKEKTLRSSDVVFLFNHFAMALYR